MKPCFWLLACCAIGVAGGCATMRESDTARTGVEQLLISTAVDRSLDKVDLAPLRGAQVYVEEKYLDCTDKNYVIVSLHERVTRAGCTLVDKPDTADVILEIASGAVGTDRDDLFVGIPAIPLAMPSPISIPKVALYDRAKAMGTAKLRVLAFDAKTRQPLVDSGAQLARADYRHWNLLGAGPVVSGKVPRDLTAATGESQSIVNVPASIAEGPKLFRRRR
ncbi:MAG TPA: DUF6655 family protein [Pirellulales bacterium]|nr:DUF6655 family protein [Pirellulales bacterium]